MAEKYEIPELLTGLESDTLSNAIADILADLDSEAIPDITDRLEKVEAVQSTVTDISSAIKVLIDEFNKQSEELARQKEANTKLMYERINKKEAEDKKSEEELEDEIDQAVDAIDIYDVD